jgi:predicted metal-binding protein
VFKNIILGEWFFMKIGIIRCNEASQHCSANNCMNAANHKTGHFARYDEVEIVGIDTCNGCYHGGAKRVIERAAMLKERGGAEVIHLSTCIMTTCPWKAVFEKGIKEKVGLPVVQYTHEDHHPGQSFNDWG